MSENKLKENESVNTVNFDDFMKIDLRVGTIVQADPFPEARKPAYKLVIDFGDRIGLKKSSAQITDLYSPDSLIGQQVLGVVNLPPRQIGPVQSEILTTGVADKTGQVVLLAPDQPVPNGSRLY